MFIDKILSSDASSKYIRKIKNHPLYSTLKTGLQSDTLNLSGLNTKGYQAPDMMGFVNKIKHSLMQRGIFNPKNCAITSKTLDGEVTKHFDNYGRVFKEITKTPKGIHSVEYKYAGAGHIEQKITRSSSTIQIDNFNNQGYITKHKTMSSSGNIREVKEYYYNNSNQVSEMILHVPNKDTEYYKYSYYYNGKPQKIIQETNYGHVLTSEYDYYGNMTKQIQTLSPTERYITEYKHGLIQKGINIDTASHRVQIDRYVNGELDYIEPIQITKEIENNSRKNISKIYESSLDYDKNQLLESISNELENVYTIDDIEYYQQLLEKVPECVSKNILRDRISLKQYHYYFCETNKDNLFAGINNFNSFWMQYDAKNQCHGAWKMHLYADGELDWQKMAETVVPYLKKNDIEWKTVSQITSMDTLRNDTLQAGKAFTIYPRNNEHMAQVIRDLDNLIRINGLRTRGTNIIGDRAIGDNGRLFYRYEYSTGKAKDLVLDLNTKSGYARYDSLYDSNSDRVARHGEGRYLADDMTSADDPWLNFRI